MQIRKLEPSKKVKGRWLAHLDDGDIVRVTEDELVSFGLYSGMELDEGQLAQLRAAVTAGSARRRAAGMLAARPLSRKELGDKLKQKGESPEDVEAALARMAELGFLDDAAYARTVARHYSAKGYGAAKVRQELYRRGVPREHWDEAFGETEAPDDAIDALLRTKLRGGALPDDRKELKRISDMLARRGFSWSDIGAALRRYGAKIEDS